jgi:hypothetical protein
MGYILIVFFGTPAWRIQVQVFNFIFKTLLHIMFAYLCNISGEDTGFTHIYGCRKRAYYYPEVSMLTMNIHP